MTRDEAIDLLLDPSSNASLNERARALQVVTDAVCAESFGAGGASALRAFGHSFPEMEKYTTKAIAELGVALARMTA